MHHTVMFQETSFDAIKIDQKSGPGPSVIAVSL